MTSLLGSAQFWFGALLLCAFQFAKFNEIKPLDTGLKALSAVPDLRARDFVGLLPYRVTLVLFVLVTLAGYVVLCLASPSLIGGWLRIVGQQSDAAEIDGIAQSSAYPLWIAAAFMGLAHQTIPGLARISNVQRDMFHDLVGIPRALVETSAHFSTQILAQSLDRRSRGERLALMCSDRWRAGIEPIADIGFLEAQLERLKLDDEDDIKDARAGSVRELRASIEQVVCVACIATVRKGGIDALAELAGHLGVEKPRAQPGLWQDLLAPALGCFTALVVLLFLLPMATPLAARLMGGEVVFWPSGEGALSSSAVYLVGLVIPVLVAAAILASWTPRKADAEGSLLVVGLFVVFYDLAQTLWDYGFNNVRLNQDTGQFIGHMVPFIALHALVVMAICGFVQWRVTQPAPATVSRQTLDVLETVLVAAVVSAFYGWARIDYQWAKPQPFDLVPLTVLLNGAAAVMAFVAYRSIWRRRQARQQSLAPPEPLRFPAAAD
ncbi:MAG: hypothetical protein JSS04_15680 [Proteobacteria bacterium]|nr:hypothetical protein [Pseudomonadota bacterium]